MVVLDDVLSAVDKETTALIMTRLFGEGGLLRSLGTTVVMTTNTRMFCWHTNIVTSST